jgi:hypothetical protein
VLNETRKVEKQHYKTLSPATIWPLQSDITSAPESIDSELSGNAKYIKKLYWQLGIDSTKPLREKNGKLLSWPSWAICSLST